MNDRFQRMSYWISEKAGTWPHFAFWVAAVLAWLALGPSAGWSNGWQLLANTPTTIIELFLGLAILVDGERQITMLSRMLIHQSNQQDRIENIELHVLRLVEALSKAEGVSDETPESVTG